MPPPSKPEGAGALADYHQHPDRIQDWFEHRNQTCFHRRDVADGNRQQEIGKTELNDFEYGQDQPLSRLG
jgi:hypothetical protein